MTIANAVVIYAFIITILAVWFFTELLRSHQQLRRAIETNKHNERVHEQNTAINQQAALATAQLINCAKLVAIHRSGRVNVFTFARNDDMFTIETMGLLGDDVVGWRKQAGLTE